MTKRVYQHIDNGGIDFSISKDDDFNTEIRFLTEYFGYPSIEARVYGMISSEKLREIGEAFIEHADKLNKAMNEPCAKGKTIH